MNKFQEIIEESKFIKLGGLTSLLLRFPITGEENSKEIYLSARNGQILPENRQQQLSASTIKVFLLLVFYQILEKKGISSDSTYQLKASDLVEGGSLYEREPGDILTYDELVKHMLVESDNSATNILIDRIAEISQEPAFDFINQQIREFGFEDSILQRKMMDFGNPLDNYTSAKDLADALAGIISHKYDFLEDHYDKILADIAECNNRTKLVAQLDKKLICYHKTGENEFRGIENDAGIIIDQSGKQMILVCLAQYFDPEVTEQILDENLEAKPEQIREQQRAIAELAHDLSEQYFGQ